MYYDLVFLVVCKILHTERHSADFSKLNVSTLCKRLNFHAVTDLNKCQSFFHYQ